MRIGRSTFYDTRPPGLSYFGTCGVLRVQGWPWLDYDAIVFAVLAVGIGIVMLVALSI